MFKHVQGLVNEQPTRDNYIKEHLFNFLFQFWHPIVLIYINSI